MQERSRRARNFAAENVGDAGTRVQGSVGHGRCGCVDVHLKEVGLGAHLDVRLLRVRHVLPASIQTGYGSSEKERESKRARERVREIEKERVCVWERDRERAGERESARERSEVTT